MKKLSILLLSLTFVAASCDLSDPFSLGGGSKGVLKSEDSAQTFHAKNKIKQSRRDLSSLSVNALVFDPKNPDVLYLGSASGLHKSEDSGESWTYILTGIAVGDVRVDPNASNIVYSAGISGNNGKIIKSYDSGTTWIDIYSEPSKGNAVLALDVLKFNSKILIAGLNNGEIVRSSDEGRTWQLVKDFQDRVVEIRSAGNASVYALTRSAGLYKSTDLGATWTEITGSLTSSSLFSRNSTSVSVSAFYDLALDQRQPGVIYLGTEQGLLRSIDDGVSWSFLSLPARDNSQLRVSAVAVNPANSNNIYASISSTLFKSLNGGVTWETKKLPTSAVLRQVLINPNTPNIVYLGMGEQKQ
ncbi:MAG: hypothetical protein HY545_02595 [Candidatus Doudnabacteria bacterium]|nr:hypothetical protein [Candidatus Doudnabacteria bacterium]